jgi:hypothetical protein
MQKHTLNLASLNLIRDILWALSINLASNRESSSQNLLDGTLKVLSHGLESHGSCNVDDFLQWNRLCVLDVLLLLSVAWWFLEGLDDEGGGGWDDGDGGLTILDGEADGHTETFLRWVLVIAGLRPLQSGSLPSHQWLWQYLLRPSLGRDREDQSLGRVRRRHRLHHQSRASGCGYQVRNVFVCVDCAIGLRALRSITYMTFTSLGSNFGAEKKC